ncbi:MAG TPA: VOC family protein [Gemmatimonadales bacterium]|nr:VOC family protein [Gemmatimonadales bacterium]
MATSQRTPTRRQQPESLRLRSITPVFTVNNIQRSIAFYRDGLGFFISERWEEGGQLVGVMLKAGACHLGLSQDDFNKGRDRPKGVGFRISCETFQDVDAIAERLKTFGGTIIEGPGERYDNYGFTAEDPDGFKITIGKAKE